MNQQIQKVLYFIENNLDMQIDLDDLARIAGYSKYHFSRCFKLNVGESVTDYIIRLRLEKSQFKIIQKVSVINVALDVGYETPNGFNKAFKKVFGISPTRYKKLKKDFLNQFQGKLQEVPKEVMIEDKYVVFTREIGDYSISSKIAWDKLSSSCISKGSEVYNITQKSFIKAELIGICHDDPTVTKAENIRYDACVYFDDEITNYFKKCALETKKIDGGKYIKGIHFGKCDGAIDTWYSLYSWCEQNGYKFRDIPPFEKYISNEDESIGQITEIYLPIEN